MYSFQEAKEEPCCNLCHFSVARKLDSSHVKNPDASIKKIALLCHLFRQVLAMIIYVSLLTDRLSASKLQRRPSYSLNVQEEGK